MESRPRVKRPRVRASGSQPWIDVLENFADALVVIDHAGKIVLFNHAAEEMAGLAQSRVLGEPAVEVFAASPVVPEMLARVAQTGQSESRGDAQLGWGGRTIPARLTCLPLWDARGSRRGIALVVHDLTYQRTLEESARRNESLARLGTLVAGLAHEIRNPLAGIKGAAQLLASRLAESDDKREYTNVITREVDRLSALVEDLLTLGAPPKPTLRPLNIHQVIRHLLTLLEGELTRLGIRIVCEFDPSLPDVSGDEVQLTQVFLNLLKNAMDAMTAQGSAAAPRGTIIIRTRMETDFYILHERDRASKFLRVEIADQGSGIDPADAGRVFEPFFTTKARGVGLGLAISDRIVAEHGGSIRTAANRPRGTVVTVTLPVARP